MLEAKQNNRFQFNDDNLQVLQKDFRLPRIERPVSKAKTKLTIQTLPIQYSEAKLPTLKIDSTPVIYDSASEISDVSQRQTLNSRQQGVRKKTESESQDDDFITEIEKKLKMVLEEQNIVDFDESDSGSDDFQRKIIENKEIIKMHKLRKEIEVHPNNFVNSQAAPTALPNQKLLSRKQKQAYISDTKMRSRNESLYEKRAREYRDSSMENRYLQRKKENVAIKISKEIALKEIKSKEAISMNKIIPSRPFDKEKEKQKGKDKYRQRQRFPCRQSPDQSKKDLFDGIQNFLENPKKNELAKARVPYKPPLAIKKNRKQLEQKLKRIEEKLKQNGQEEPEESEAAQTGDNGNPPINEGVQLLGTIQQWKKVWLNQTTISHVETNFEKEIERIDQYVQRNQQSMETYVSHQKLMLEIDLFKKFKAKSVYVKEKSATAHTEN